MVKFVIPSATHLEEATKDPCCKCTPVNNKTQLRVCRLRELDFHGRFIALSLNGNTAVSDWVYKTGPLSDDPFGNPQYDYAIISNWVRYPVMVLVRDPDKFKQKYETEVLRWLEDNQFINPFTRAFNLLQPASYDNCQYADSTFEVFGK